MGLIISNLAIGENRFRDRLPAQSRIPRSHLARLRSFFDPLAEDPQFLRREGERLTREHHQPCVCLFAELGEERADQVFHGVDLPSRAAERVDGEQRRTSVMKLALSEESYQRFKTAGIPYTAKVPASVAPRYVKLVVYEYRSGSVGAATTKIK